MTITIPTILSVDTIVRAIKAISIYSSVFTGICCERAYSLSNARYSIGLLYAKKKAIRDMLITNKAIKSSNPIVKMFPKRYEDKSVAYPGVRNVKIIPTAIPKVQKTAMAESSRISLLLLNHLTPAAEATANIAAESIGDIPVYSPIPIPPNDA